MFVCTFTVKLKIFARVIYYRETSHMRSFVKIKSSQNAENTLSFTDICKSCTSREFLASQMCLLTLFTKIKLSQKFPDLQYIYLLATVRYIYISGVRPG